MIVRTVTKSAVTDSVDLNALKVKKNDVIVLEVVPNNGFINGLPVTATATVVN